MFDLKKYKKSYYELHKEEQLERARIRYIENRDKIRERVKIRRLNESPEEKVTRLSFHKTYNSLHRERQHDLHQSDKYKFKMYAFAAKRRNYDFGLSLEEFSKIFNGQCNYCAEEPARGIDRVDNTIGYTKENSVPCCEMCNKMKWRWSKEEFISQIIKINKKISCQE